MSQSEQVAYLTNDEMTAISCVWNPMARERGYVDASGQGATQGRDLRLARIL